MDAVKNVEEVNMFVYLMQFTSKDKNGNRKLKKKKVE